MKDVTVWLNANEILLNLETTELVIFTREKNLTLKLKLNLIENDFTLLNLLDILELRWTKI